MKSLKLIGGIGMLVLIGLLVNCGEPIVDAFDADVQLEEDIAIIEDFIAEKGWTEYDTLESGARVYILDEGDGAPIEYTDIVHYDYIGQFIDEVVFDTSIESIAYDQDLTNTIDTTFVQAKAGGDSLDIDGEKVIETINYEEDYIPIYSSFRTYESYVTVHTPGGWYIQQEGLVSGFKDGVHALLENVNLGGSALVMMPSVEGYGRTGSFSIPPNSVIMFELRAVDPEDD